MADKGIGVGECPDHGEYPLDVEDSPCPSCEDDVPSDNQPMRKYMIARRYVDEPSEDNWKEMLKEILELEGLSPEDLKHIVIVLQSDVKECRIHAASMVQSDVRHDSDFSVKRRERGKASERISNSLIRSLPRDVLFKD